MNIPKKSLLAAAVATLISPLAQAEFEITGYLKNETAVFIKDGPTIGEPDNVADDLAGNGGHSAGDLLKSEFMARGFINGDLSDNSSLHAEINLIYDTEGVNDDLKGHKSYTQQDYLRELYVDTALGNWNFRLGKQQVVWGTADGIKLLDIINPTDFRELVQNTQEDSRIPVWMINAETNIGDSGNLQFIASESRPNFIPGLDAKGDQGQPFIMKGVDTITGKVNGFLNIAPNLGSTAAKFVGLAFQGFGAPSLTAAGGGFLDVAMFTAGLSPFCPTSPDGQTPNPDGVIPGPQGPTNPFAGLTCSQMLNAIAQSDFPTPDPNVVLPGNKGVTNLVDPVYDPIKASSAFELMPNATFATFDTFAGIKSKFVDNTDDAASEGNLGFRYKGATEAGTNWSVNFLRSYGPNPSVNLHWEDSAGNRLAVNKINTVGVDLNQDGDLDDPTPQPGVLEKDFQSPLTTLALANADGTAFNPATQGGPATLVFEETLDPVINIGSSFDTNFDTESLGAVVLRGEFLYQKDVPMPVVNRNELAIGNLTEALKMQDSDFFRYVLGLDITVATNLLVSTQLIQFINLDYIDDKNGANGQPCSTQANPFDPTQTPDPVRQANCGRYTADFPTLHLSNNLQKGDEVETFLSFFLSKPFGPSQEHRWNNIIIAENGGGYWDRFDVEYTFTDFLIGTAEVDVYFGDEDTQFGQFKNSSNLQLGLKYLFQ